MNRTTMVVGFLLLCTFVASAQAFEPLWIYSGNNSKEVGYGVSVSSDGSSVVGALGQMYILDGKGKTLWGGEMAYEVAMTDDGAHIAAGTLRGTIFLDRTGKTIWIDSTYKRVTEISMQGDGRYIGAFGGSTLSLYNSEGTVLWRNSTQVSTSLAVSPDGSMMVIGSPSGIKGLNQKGFEIWSHGPIEINQVLFSHDGSFVATASGHSVKVFDPSGDLLWNYQTSGTLSKIAISHNDAYIAAGNTDKKVYLLDRKGGLIRSYEIGDPVSSVAISGDGSFIAAGSTSGSDKRLYLFNNKGGLVGTYQTNGWVVDVSLSSDGSSLAAVDDGYMYYFKTGPVTAESVSAATVATPITSGTETQPTPAVQIPSVPAAPATTPTGPQPTKSEEMPLYPVVIAGLTLIFISRLQKRIG